jgi:hypothetical protein
MLRGQSEWPNLLLVEAVLLRWWKLIERFCSIKSSSTATAMPFSFVYKLGNGGKTKLSMRRDGM